MNVADLLGPLLTDVAKSIGLASGSGDLDGSWFAEPLARLESVLSNATQRAAVLDLLDQIAPPEQIQGVPATEKWHPLLGTQPSGNLYAIVDDSKDPTIVVGIGGRYGSPAAAVRFTLPVASFSASSFVPVAGTAAGPLQLTLAVPLAWTTPAHAIALQAIEIALVLAPLASPSPVADIAVTLKGLDLDGHGASDVVFTPGNLGNTATHVILGLVREKLASIAAGATGEAKALATHLMPLLGLDGALPAFPFATVATDAHAIAKWFASLVTPSPSLLAAWLGHLAGLLGVATPNVVTTQTGGATTCAVSLFAPNAASSVDLSLVASTAADGVTPGISLVIGIALVPGGVAPPARFDADVMLLTLPLAGSATIDAFSGASLVVSAPGDRTQPLIAAGSGVAFSVDSFRAGIAWTGSGLAPLLELLGVVMDGAPYPRIDLSNANTIVAAASNALASAVAAALGTSGPGKHLAALAGLIEPADDASAPLVDPIALATHPTAAIGTLHRNALLGTTHPWSNYFNEIMGLLSLAGPVGGDGTAARPWSATIEESGPLALSLVAWNAQTSGLATDPQMLRIGLRLGAEADPIAAGFVLELIGVDLRAAGGSALALLGGMHVRLDVTPASTVNVAGIGIAATALSATIDYAVGKSPATGLVVNGLSVTSGADTVSVPTLSFPFPSGFDAQNPTPTLGIAAGELETLALAFLSSEVSSLLGTTSGWGLQADFPSLVQSAAPGALFSDPLTALKTWFTAIATTLSVDGTPFSGAFIALLTNALAGAPVAGPAGSGTYDDPWLVPLATEASAVEGLVWLEPAGPPSDAAAGVLEVSASADFSALVNALTRATPAMPPLPLGVDSGNLVAGWQKLASHLALTDGIVPTAAQVPSGWTSGTQVTSAHHLLPSNPSAIAQIIAQVDRWAAPGTSRAILLLGPAFADHLAWTALLAQAESAHPGTTSSGATFDLRIPGAAPASIDLRPVTAVADYYSADLQDDGSGDVASLANQIGLVLARIAALKPGAAIVLVAHSTIGIAARAFVAATPAGLKGLVTLGTPHGGAPLVPLTDPSTADSVRVYAALFPDGVAAGPLRDALAHLRQAVDGYLPPSSAGALPVAWPYPVGDFAGTTSTATGGVPTFAIAGTLGNPDFHMSLVDATNATLGAYAPAAPTHLAYGLRTGVPLGADAAIAVDATLRIDAGRFAFTAGAPDPPRAVRALTASLALSRPGGWLVGDPRSYVGPSTAPSDVRVRGAELGVALSLAGATSTLAPFARLHDAAFHSPSADVAWGDARLDAVLGALFGSIAVPAPPKASSLATLLAVLQTLGIVVPGTSSSSAAAGFAMSADALASLRIDALGYLAPRVAAAVRSGSLAGFALAQSPSVLSLAPLPFEAFITLAPATFGIRTSTAGLSLGGEIDLAFSFALDLETLSLAPSATLQAGPVALAYAGGTLNFAAPPAVAPVQIYPRANPSAIATALGEAVAELLISSAASAALDSVLPAGSSVRGLLSFLSSPGAWLVGTSALGNGSVFDPLKITQLLARIGTLPAGLTLSASGTNPTTLVLATTTPLGGVLDLAFGISIDATRHLEPSGTIAVRTPLGGTWPSVAIEFGVKPGGVTLAIVPGGAAPITLLPTFGGAGALAGAALALLPSALDGLLGKLAPPPGAPPEIVALTLQIATALNLYDAAGGFAAHAAAFSAMTAEGWFANVAASARSAFTSAVANYYNDPSSPLHDALPGTIAASGSTVTWTYPLPGSLGSGSLALALGWDASGPTVGFAATGVTLASAPVAVTLASGFVSGALALNLTLGVALQDALGLDVVPQLVVNLAGSTLSIAFLPLGAGTATSFAIELLPEPAITLAGDAAMQIVEAYVIPLAADLLIGALADDFTKPMWAGGPTVEHVLASAHLVTAVGGAQKYRLVTPLAPVATMLAGLLQAVAPVTVPLAASPPLSLAFVDDAGSVGLRFVGSIAVASGPPQFSLLFGAPATWLGPQAGVTLYLFDTSDGLQFAPILEVRGFGVGLAGDGDSPLLNASGFRVGAIDGYAAFTLDLSSGALSHLGGGLEIDKLGLPLGQLDAVTSSNPVAASLFDSNGGSGNGDTTAANPSVDVIAYDLDNSFVIEFAGTNQPIVIPVHATFGPLYLDQIDLSLNGSNEVDLGVDGSLSMAGLTIGVIDLALAIPLSSLLSPEHWGLDLQGLAVGFDEGPIAISGGLRKNPGPPVEYDGMLSVTIAGLGLTIVGAYSRPSDADGSYTSLWMFLSLPIPLGGPPMAFVMGLGGGFGYNRELKIPTDLGDIDSFILVAAIDGDGLSNDPMTALVQMGAQVPSRRGSFWIAGGVRITSFALIQSTVIVAIALDRGFEIDILGISRMALPYEDIALVSVELALKARFNSEEGVLSIQAQLTDNSYLFSHDCQLTGGFAFFVWYDQGQFVLTLGGYNPTFSPPAEFPNVPRLGFNWSIGNYICIKGGAYFALTNSCVMAGGSLSATASIGPISAWFDAYVDFMISWDPFGYEFDIGVEIGVSLTIKICFFGCVHIKITLSDGASLQIAGPPFHGTASIDAYVTTITVSFGDPPQSPDYITDWGTFAAKYLIAGDPAKTAVSLGFTKGVLAQDPPGAPPQPGTQAQPRQVGIEWALQTTTRMPATTLSFAGTSLAVGNLNAIDLAPMYELSVASAHALDLAQLQKDGSWLSISIDANHVTVSATNGFFPEATWHWVDPQHIPAAARTITALAGLALDAHVVFVNQSALIPISTLVDDLPAFALPLPFATTASVSPTLIGYGTQAADLALAVSHASSASMVAASLAVLGGNGVFSQNRVAFGLPAGGIGALAASSLRGSRSAPPLVSPITTGLTMLPVGLKAPAVATVLAPVAAVTLEGPRLRAMLQRRPTAVTDVPPAIRTTVSARDIPRMAAPTPAAVIGARLLVVAAADAPRPTTAAVRPRALRNAELGAGIGRAHQAALVQAASDVLAGGVTLGAGAAHLWDLATGGGAFTLGGNGCVRMICAARNGAILSDSEFAANERTERSVAPGTALTILECLGALPAGTAAPQASFGGVSSTYAASGEAAVVGWQSASTLLQIGPAHFVARGASLRVTRPFASRRNGQRASYGTPQARDVVDGQTGVETQLPASVDVVMIALDGVESGASGDLALGVAGGTLAASPQRVTTGNRRLLCYDVVARDPAATALSISFASGSAWVLSGIVGARGSASEWATSLRGGIPDHFVPEGPLAPGGSLNVTYAAGVTP